MNNITVFDGSIFEVVDGKVNLTKICKTFDKSVNEWKRLPSTQAFLKVLESDMGESPITTFRGNNGKEQGTFGNRQVALKLAQWISPEFEVFCIQKLDELFQTGKTELKKQSTLEYLKQAVIELEQAEKEIQKLALENTTLASRDLEVKTQKEYKWIKEEVKRDRGRAINWYVMKHFYTGDYKKAHDSAKEAYRQDTGVDLPSKIDLASLEMKKAYLEWLSR